MFCRFCGTEIEEGQTTCPSCNHPLNVKTQKPKNKRKMRTVTKVFISIISTFGIIAAIGGSSLAYYFQSPARKIYMDIEEGNYREINKIYDAKVKENSIQEMILSHLLNNQIERTAEQFEKGEAEYTKIEGKLTAIESLGIKEITKIAEDKKEQLGKLNVSMTSYKQAEAYYAQDNYREAMEEYKKVIENDSNYADAQRKVKECQEKYEAEIIEKTKNLSTEEEYNTALQIMGEAVEVLSDNEKMKERQTKIQKEFSDFLKSEALSKGNQYIEEENYLDAFESIKKALEQNPNDPELLNLQEQAQNRYFESVRRQINGYLETESFDDAEKSLKEAQTLFPDSEIVKELTVRISDARPVPLISIDNYDEYKYESAEEVTITEDAAGNFYNPENLFSLSCYPTEEYGYVTYYLNGDYDVMKGTVAVAADSGDGVTGKFVISDEYGKTLYAIENWSRAYGPFNFEIDLKNVKWIRIAVDNTTGRRAADQFKILVANTVLYK